MRLFSCIIGPRSAMPTRASRSAVLVALLAGLVSGCVTTTTEQPGLSTGMTQPAPTPTPQPLRTSQLGQPGIKKDTLTPNDLLYLNYLNSNRHLMTSVDNTGAVFITVYDGTVPRFVMQLNPDGTLSTTHYLSTANSSVQILDSHGDGVPDVKVESFTDGRNVLSKLVNPNWAPLAEPTNGAAGPLNAPPAGRP